MAPRLGATDLQLYWDNRVHQALHKSNYNAIDSAMVRRVVRTRIALRRDPYGNLSAQQTGDLSRQGDRARGDQPLQPSEDKGCDEAANQERNDQDQRDAKERTV